MSNDEKPRAFLTQSEVAERWRISERTLENWRNGARFHGPRPTKIGSRVRYAFSEVVAFEKAHQLGEYERD